MKFKFPFERKKPLKPDGLTIICVTLVILIIAAALMFKPVRDMILNIPLYPI